MIEVAMQKDTTPEKFVVWLGKHTLHLPEIPTHNGYIALQRSYPYTPIGDLSRVVIQGIRVYRRSAPDPDQGGFPLDYITFDLIPLASERTEITARCWSDEPAVTDYFNQLRAEIDQAWPEAHGASMAKINQELAEIKAKMGAGNGKKPHPKLTDDDIQHRREIVKQANQMRKDDPKRKWKDIAREIGEPVRTLQYWRHNNNYK